MNRATRTWGFSLIELLIVVAITAILVSILAPALSGVRSAARTVACLSNQRQLGVAWSVYADDFQSYAMPVAADDTGPDEGDTLYWFGGAGDETGVTHAERGFLAPYLQDTLRERGVYECPEQPWGSYSPQGLPRSVTTTYGYNGYYLSPSATPGWNVQIGQRPWRRIWDIPAPADLLVFGDTLLAGDPARNTALLDPPMLFSPWRGWQPNAFPTTSFRHRGAVAVVTGDVSASTIDAERAWYTHPQQHVGSVGTTPDRYVPDWRDW
jgi:prepilin-type N-terminal cleavage/methylation domain-containing protein